MDIGSSSQWITADSDYDGSCPTRWWCPIEKFGKLWDDYEVFDEGNINLFTYFHFSFTMF